eukprot:CAMPEP_0170508218 /NCGR_PEP_ID=MMETSP0208-20121228/61641_1 /TAXON_ID=197538 /ORGANISM="Strombidium inclinatum, Strain S3" /LENGTH=122 /DNA_ID=CAMNT_0010790981 /DNA_START=303 /DNA_END=668 /DNA_ORIENTATION=-
MRQAIKAEMMYVTHRQLKDRMLYFGGLPPENHMFRIEDSHPKNVDPPFLMINELKTSTDIFKDLYSKGESALPMNFLGTIPSLSSIFRLPAFTANKDKIFGNINLFELFRPHYEATDEDLEW